MKSGINDCKHNLQGRCKKQSDFYGLRINCTMTQGGTELCSDYHKTIGNMVCLNCNRRYYVMAYPEHNLWRRIHTKAKHNFCPFCGKEIE